LLTGGAGYIGSHTSIVLKNAGHRPIILDNFKNSQKSLLSQLEVINKEKMLYVEGDIRDTRLICDLLDEYQVDAVIHFAALKSISESIKNPVSYYSNNVQGTISLLQAMIDKDVKKLVFSSSATVYGNPQYLPVDESHQTHATNAYGRSKLHIEEMLSDLTNSDPKWRIVSLRYFNPVGAHESGLIGEIPHGDPSNLMPFIAKVAARKLPKLNIFGGDYETVDGTGVRD